jgi:hypothetical protein
VTRRLALLVLLLAACSTARVSDYGRATSAQVTQAVRVHDAGFDSYIQYEGPGVRRDLPGGGELAWDLRGWRDRKTGADRHELRVDLVYGSLEWRHYGAYALDAATQPLKSIDRSVEACATQELCRYREIFAVPLSTTVLRERYAGGLSVRMTTPKGDSIDLRVPVAYLQGYLLAAGWRADAPKPLASPATGQLPPPDLPGLLPLAPAATGAAASALELPGLENALLPPPAAPAKK